MRKKKAHVEPQIGVKIGRLTVIDFCRVGEIKGVVCVCDCGNVVQANFFSVKYGLKSSCGCAYGLKLKGRQFGRLIVLEDIPSDNSGRRMVRCLCRCGNQKIVESYAIKRGNYKSCGCNQFPTTTKKYRGHPLYDVWKGIKARCRDGYHIGYGRYGAKGVYICSEWANDFTAFYNWALSNGWKQGMQIDKDIKAQKMGIPALVYSPEMCSVVTRNENIRASSQTKLTVEIAQDILLSTLTYKQLADKYNVNICTIQRVKSNKSWQ